MQDLKDSRVFRSNLWCGLMVIAAFDDLGLVDDHPFPATQSRKA